MWLANYGAVVYRIYLSADAELVLQVVLLVPAIPILIYDASTEKTVGS